MIPNSALFSDLTLLSEAERQASPFPPLLVAADKVAATVLQGVHGRRRSGQGEAFWQHRSFEIGDAPRLIDWRQSGKSDRLFVREMEWEASQSVWFWMNRTPSMDWRSHPALATKAQVSSLCLLSLACLLNQAGELIGFLGEDKRPSRGLAKVQNLAHFLSTKADSGTQHKSNQENDSQHNSHRLPPHMSLARHSVMILFSDFFDPFEDISRNLLYFADRDVKIHLVQVLDPAEAELPYKGRVRFEDVDNTFENDKPLFSRVENIRDRYRDRLHTLQGALDDMARHAGWSFHIHRTDMPLTPLLMTLHQALALKRKR